MTLVLRACSDKLGRIIASSCHRLANDNRILVNTTRVSPILSQDRKAVLLRGTIGKKEIQDNGIRVICIETKHGDKCVTHSCIEVATALKVVAGISCRNGTGDRTRLG